LLRKVTAFNAAVTALKMSTLLFYIPTIV